MMTQTPATHSPVRLGLAGLLAAVMTALLAAGAVMAVVLTVIDQESAWRGFVAGTTASVIAGLASAVPVWIGSRFGTMGVVGGYFIASFLRAGIAIGGCLVAIWIRDYPPVSTLVCMGVHYMAVLTAESIVVARALWRQPVE